jgi:hypothetical protein
MNLLTAKLRPMPRFVEDIFVVRFPNDMPLVDASQVTLAACMRGLMFRGRGAAV